MFHIRFYVAAMVVVYTSVVHAREWTDTTGNYTISADIAAYSDSVVVLKKANDELVAVPIGDLSKADRAHLKSKDPDESVDFGKSTQQWTLKSGMKLPGRIVDYHQHDLTIQRRLGRVYVNNQRYEKLPAMYRAIIPKIVSHFTKETIDGEKGLVAWAREQKGKPRKFRCDGFLMELADENLYCIPFFLFSEKNLTVLRPGWERWLEAKEDQQQKDEQSFLLRTQAEAYEREKQQAMQIQQLQLNVQAYDAGIFDLWEVEMRPRPGYYGMPVRVVVPATDSAKAAERAKRKNPSYVIGTMRIVRRRN